MPWHRPSRGTPERRWHLAPVGYTLWNHALNYDVSDPRWINRDRFVLSAGHASMLLYSLLHLAGVRRAERRPSSRWRSTTSDVPPARQPVCRTPRARPTDRRRNAPPARWARLGNSVGMAIACNWLAAHFNRPGFDLFDYNVYALCSDGDLMEGIGQRSRVDGRHLKLDNLCWIYDDNAITIEGETSLAFTEDVATRFAGLRMDRHPRGRRQRHRRPAKGIRPIRRAHRIPDAHRRQQHHWLRRTDQAGHRLGAQ